MISKYSVQKVYTVLVAVVLVIVLGVVSFSRMITDLLPNMTFPYALIITTDVGASPEKIEREVTAPIEAAMATTSNIKNIKSTSYNSFSIVILEYEQKARMDSVLIEIQQSLDQLKGNWASTVGTPIILQVDPDMLPIMTVAVDMNGKTAAEISDYVKSELSQNIESVEGVASVNLTGNVEERIQVTMNGDKLNVLNERIQEAIQAQFQEAEQKITEGRQQFESSQEEAKSGLDKLEEGKQEITGKKEQLSAARKELEDKKKAIQEQEANLQKVYDMLDFFIDSEEYRQLQLLYDIKKLLSQADGEITQGMLSMLREYLARIDTDRLVNYVAKQRGQEAADRLREFLRNPEEGLSDPLGFLRQLDEQLQVADKAIASQFSALTRLGIKVSGFSDLKTARASLGVMLTQVRTGYAAIDTALKQVESGEAALNDAMNVLNYNTALAALQSSAAGAKVAAAQISLDEAQKSLDTARETALSGADLNRILTEKTLGGILTAQNLDMPAGYVSEGREQYLIRVGEAITSVEDLKSLVLMDMNLDSVGSIRLEDVADIEVLDNSDKTYAHINGNPGIMLSMEKQTGYATGDVTSRLLDKFKAMEKENPDLHFSVLMNQGIYIKLIVSNVIQNMILGAILAVIVLLVFLKDPKPTLVIACSIPLSVVTAIVLMYFSGVTLNIISMSGLALGIGMLVDNSIVVIENIYRLRGEGLPVKKASVMGANQVAGAIAASTLTTISVFAPIVFTDGITKQLFADMALTILFTLGASLAVALSFVPAMGSAIMKNTKEIRHPLFDRMKQGYRKMLPVCLKYKPIVFILSILLLAGSAAAALSRGFEFINMGLEADQMSVTVGSKKGQQMTFAELVEATREVVKRIETIEGIDTVGAMAGGNSTVSLMGGGGSSSASIYLLLSPDNKKSTKEIAEEILEKTKDIDCRVNAQESTMDISSFFATGITLEIRGNRMSTLQDLTRQISEVMKGVEGVRSVNDGLDKNQVPQFSILVDKEKAAEVGYTVAQVYQLIYEKVAETRSSTTVSTNLKDYEVYIKAQDRKELSLDEIRNLSFFYTDKKNQEEKEVFLKDICTFREETTLSNIYRDSQIRYLSVTAWVDEDHNVSLVSREIQKRLKDITLPEGFQIKMTGEDENIRETMSQLLLMMLLAIIFIYLIMVAQFQSLLSPFIVMFTIPLAFTGGFLALYISGFVVSVISMLGFIMLAGLIVNNGIVLIDYINQERRAGMLKKDAIVSAGVTRLRPILMTSLTTIISMMVMAIGVGTGSEMMQPMAITMIGGLVYGTLLTLIVVPCIYDAFLKEKSMVEEEL